MQQAEVLRATPLFPWDPLTSSLEGPQVRDTSPPTELPPPGSTSSLPPRPAAEVFRPRSLVSKQTPSSQTVRRSSSSAAARTTPQLPPLPSRTSWSGGRFNDVLNNHVTSLDGASGGGSGGVRERPRGGATGGGERGGGGGGNGGGGIARGGVLGGGELVGDPSAANRRHDNEYTEDPTSCCPSSSSASGSNSSCRCGKLREMLPSSTTMTSTRPPCRPATNVLANVSRTKSTNNNDFLSVRTLSSSPSRGCVAHTVSPSPGINVAMDAIPLTTFLAGDDAGTEPAVLVTRGRNGENNLLRLNASPSSWSTSSARNIRVVSPRENIRRTTSDRVADRTPIASHDIVGDSRNRDLRTNEDVPLPLSRRTTQSDGVAQASSTGHDTTTHRCTKSTSCERCGRCRCNGCRRRRSLPHCWCGSSCECSADRFVEYTTCLCCVKAAFYHCCIDAEDEDYAEFPCGCCSHRRCAARWAFLALAAVFLPCLCLYWPARGLVSLAGRCHDARPSGRCRCRPLLSSTVSSVVGGSTGMSALNRVMSTTGSSSPKQPLSNKRESVP